MTRVYGHYDEAMLPLSPPAPALIAADIDGTFVDDKGAIPPKNLDALQRAHENGLDFCLVTARPPRWLTRFQGLSAGAIYAANGAYILDAATGAILEDRGFSISEVRAVARALAPVSGIALSAETVEGFVRERAFPSAPAAGERDRESDATFTLLSEISCGAGKILAVSSLLDTEEFYREVRSRIEGLAELHVSTSDGLAELGPIGISKATALAHACHARRIAPAQVWAVGDMPNDLPMLNAAGVGIAVRNAHPDLHAHADALAPANTDAGVAHVIDAALRARALARTTLGT
ncbi:phosphatase yitU [Mycobacteroides abscessus subsp. abscessus]|nr:phosphatase yitU [Mycobacteroides abscessus subsp. abscessus]